MNVQCDAIVNRPLLCDRLPRRALRSTDRELDRANVGRPKRLAAAIHEPRHQHNDRRLAATPLQSFALAMHTPTPAKSREPDISGSRLSTLNPRHTNLDQSTRVLHDIPRIEHRRRAALAGFEPQHDVVVELGFAADRRLRHRDRPVFHVGERPAEIADEPILLGRRRRDARAAMIRRYASRLSNTR